MPYAKKTGRPSKITRETIRKLEEGFTRGLNDREACLYADISASVLYSYCEMVPSFYERKELLKESVKLIAKMNIERAIKKGDKPISQWYLERKAKDEFSIRTETQTSGNITFEVMRYDDSPVIEMKPIVLIDEEKKVNTLNSAEDIIETAKELKSNLIRNSKNRDRHRDAHINTSSETEKPL